MTLQRDSVLPRQTTVLEIRSFDDEFAVLFRQDYQRIYRFLDRMSGDPDAAEDLAQETFVRLYRRGSMPDDAGAWLISVGMNLLRNMASSARRRNEIIKSHVPDHSESVSADEAALARETQSRVRHTVDGMIERDRSLMLLRAEGYSYREIAEALGINVASVGTLLARAQRSFRSRYEESGDAR